MTSLTDPWTSHFGLPPWGKIDDDAWAPAFDAAMDEARAEVARIAENSEAPSFENTIHALELSDRTLSRITGAFYAVPDQTPARQAIEREYEPKFAALGSEIIGNAALFARIEALWQDRESLGLMEEQARVLHLTHRNFVRQGAQLTGEDAARMAKIKGRLSVLGTQFAQNVLADESGWRLELSPEDLTGLPDFALAALRAAGEGRPVLTLSRSVIVPFLQFSPDRALRRRAYEAWVSRGEHPGETDNRGIVAETLALREERARLLGFDSFAAWKLAPQMAGSPEAVREMLHAIWTPARAAALEDAAEMEAMLAEDGESGPLEPWDWRYYAERLRQQRHDLNEAVLKPYFQLDRMVEAAFWTAGRLFGLSFRAIEPDLWDPHCKAWEVTREGQHIAVFIADYFARPPKRSGAWCMASRSQSRAEGETRPVVVNVCNFAAPEAGQPALLSFDDARTLFHEFGHALHQMLSDVTYESISGTSVARDFVELPSQLYEHWLEVPELLQRFATHAETGEPLPEAMMERLLAANTHDMGFQTVENVASALVDLEFHDAPAPSDPMQRQAEILDGIGMPHAIRMRHATPHFQHVFSGDGYSAGYYSYLWSETMDADAFEAFREAGDPFDAELAAKLEAHVLSRGGSEEAAALYEAFRGRMPGVEALLKGRGLLAEPA
ncbi:M3 family metallopeptidase [Pseudoroseicyclus aestuarii]|uniref:Peptidyl-dipeptidase Dcp n=1 Tax=Pseudoroseicyclus aestuarii TaxID=1795041 RepID=A0A318T8M6_9RHOB|nr:M3 family metallopeptidase [Pseudoroseicyclus aestuarii]PYE84728.1 peptidyl-dipeptidase Dcp [Pseudoroseicyclus aestuarii]